mmetsp:Transcript_29718/g.88908  ORF Transcript_29718/g.88908 Transcript_29718/m.88908 type:complete len:338 (+) Transcript_29718:191-1204(+)
MSTLLSKRSGGHSLELWAKVQPKTLHSCVQNIVALAAAKPDEILRNVRCVTIFVKSRHRNCCDPCLSGNVLTKVDIVTPAQRRNIGHDKVCPGSRHNVKAHVDESCCEPVMLGMHFSSEPSKVTPRLSQAVRNSTLQIGWDRECEVLVSACNRLHHLCRAGGIANFPPREREGLSGRPDLDGTLPHPWEREKSAVLTPAVHHVFVDLIAHGVAVEAPDQVGDGSELAVGVDLATWILRCVDKNCLCPWTECRGEGVEIELPTGRGDGDGPGDGASPADQREVAVVRRLNHHDLVPAVEQPKKGGGQHFGGPRRHEHLRVGVDLQVVPLLEVCRHGLS